MTVVAYAALRSTCVLVCWDDICGHNVCCLEGDFCSDGLWVLGRRVPFLDYEVDFPLGRAGLIAPLVVPDDSQRLRARVGGELVDLPKRWQLFPVQQEMVSSELRRCLAAGEHDF